MDRLQISRATSFARRLSVFEDEHQPLLANDGHLIEEYDNCFPIHPSRYASQEAHAMLPVYDTIHSIRREVIEAIDDPYSMEQLRSPRMNKMFLRPMVDRWYELDDISVIYCLLVNRFQFLREQSYVAHHNTVNNTRAMACELVAGRILRRFDDNNPGPDGLLLLANVLVAGFDPFQSAPPEVIQSLGSVVERSGHKKKLTALEIAIISDSKTFLSSAPCQKVVEAIYQGRVVYTPTTFLDILPDHYKHRPITLYDPRKAPLLNQYRLIVPRTRTVMELVQFSLLLFLYVLVMSEQILSDFGTVEVVFCVYAWGWILDQIATILEHGWHVYTQNLWAFLDVAFIFVFTAYFIIRLHAHRLGDEDMAELAFNILSAAAPVLLPRLAFNLFSENMLFLSLRAMIANFAVLTVLAVWCFAGFLLALDWLSHDLHDSVTIAKWMLYLWFGLDGSGIQRSVDFHWFLGPVLMVTFTFLGNTLFLTILVAMLSNTFSSIADNEIAEVQFRRAVLTFECVKSDAIFSFFPPLNLLALVIILPLKLFLTPRWFHKIIVTAVRVLNAPLLLLIGWYERRALWTEQHEHAFKFKPRRWPWEIAKLAVHGDIEAVFEIEPSASNVASPPMQEVVLDDDSPEETRPTSQLRMDRLKSVAPTVEVSGNIEQLLQEYGISRDSKPRLSEIETSISRIEQQLKKLSEVLDCNKVKE